MTLVDPSAPPVKPPMPHTSLWSCIGNCACTTWEALSLIAGIVWIAVSDFFAWLFCCNTGEKSITQPVEDETFKVNESEKSDNHKLFETLPIPETNKMEITRLLGRLAKDKAPYLTWNYRTIFSEIDQVKANAHPLRNIAYILSSHELRELMDKIQKRDLILGFSMWGMLCEGMGESVLEHLKMPSLPLNNSHSPDALYSGFCDSLGIQNQELIKLIKEKKWTDFFELLLSTVASRLQAVV